MKLRVVANFLTYDVVDEKNNVVASGLTNSAAWRYVDDHDQEAQDHEEKRDRISKSIGQW